MRGVVYALFHLFFSAMVFIIAHQALQHFPFSIFMLVWYLVGSICFTIFGIIDPKTKFWTLSRQNTLKISLYVILDVISANLFFLSFTYISASVASFTAQLFIVFSMLLGVLILHERFEFKEILASLVIISGIFLLTYSEGYSTFIGIALIALSNLTWAISTLYSKVLIKNENPVALAYLRCICFLPVSFIYIIFDNKAFVFPNFDACLLLIVGGTVGPFVNLIARLYALRNIDMSKLPLISSQFPILVIFITFLIEGSIPESHKLFGGTLAIIGTTLLILFKSRKQKPCT